MKNEKRKMKKERANKEKREERKMKKERVEKEKREERKMKKVRAMKEKREQRKMKKERAMLESAACWQQEKLTNKNIFLFSLFTFLYANNGAI
jgi:hypothetical protein